MRHRRLAGIAPVLLTALLALTPSLARAVTYDPGPLVFETTGQSMWGTGDAATLDTLHFLGTTWNATSPDIGGITGSVSTGPAPNPLWAAWALVNGPYLASCAAGACVDFLRVGDEPAKTIQVTTDTRTGAIASGTTSGKVGFNLGVSLDSGSVNATVNYDVDAVIPDQIGSGFFNLNPNSTLVGGQLSTNFPEASAKVEAVFGAKASIDGQICAFLLGCASGTTPTIGFDPKTLELLSFNDADSPGQIKVLGVLDPALFQFGDPITVPNPANPLGEVGNVTIHIPDINALGGLAGASLTASGADDFLDLRVDIDGLILGAFGLPGLGIQVDAGIFDVSGDLVDVEIGPTIQIVQDFELTPTLMVELQFDQAVQVAGVANPVTSLVSAWDALPDIALLATDTLVTPTFFLSSLFGNQTLLGIDGVFTLDALKASIALTAFGLSLDLGQLGPVFSLVQRGNLFNSPALFDQQFALGGFNTIAGDSFLLSMAADVSQPATLLLLGLGLAGAGLCRQGKRIVAVARGWRPGGWPV